MFGMDAPASLAPVRTPFQPGIFQRLATNAPRYTSYPTADRLHAGFGAGQWEAALRACGRQASQPLSLYVHIPFCESICYYCACNKVVTRHHERAQPYLDALEREMAMQAALLGERRPVSQLHFGGGTPTFLSDDQLSRLMASLRRHFDLQPQAELSIEIDPRTIDETRLRALAQMGFNRLSFGVQDFDPDVQQAVHRVQPFEAVRDLMRTARGLGFASINVDLIYGLPKQTAASFARTIGQVAGLRPDRIALYAYAHLPTRFKPQRRIDSQVLPDGAARVALLSAAIEGFQDMGYVYIGMDHFALPEDSLAQARRDGSLHRNFQGYSTQPDRDLLALGCLPSAMWGGLQPEPQNARCLLRRAGGGRTAGRARARMQRRRPVAASHHHGHHVPGRAGPGRLCCRARSAGGSGICPGTGGAAAASGAGSAAPYPDWLEVTAQGWFFVRAVAMVFDAHLRCNRVADRYSRLA
ncbi:oxygen-independent coproporphyrinogen III oxidase [Bordetella trematum]|nr:oxygen-independent coproporphyrinogen III oxidase [Bordetella trematum]